MFFAEWRKKRQDAKQFAYFQLKVLAYADLLMGFPGDDQFTLRLCQEYPRIPEIIGEDYKKDASDQAAKTTAVNLVSGVLHQELSKLSSEQKLKLAAELDARKHEPPKPDVGVMDVGGKGIAKEAGRTIRSLRRETMNDVAKIEEVAKGNPELMKLLRSPSSGEAALATMLLSARDTANLWAQRKFIDAEASEYRHFAEMLVYARQ